MKLKSKSNQKIKTIGIFLFLSAILIMLLLINHNICIYGKKISAALSTEKAANGPKIKLSTVKSILIGDIPSNLTITLFIDYECSFCREFMQKTYPLLYENYITKGKITLEIRQFPLPFHSNATLLAKAAICADRNNKYLAFQEALFNSKEQINETSIARIMENLAISKTLFMSCLSDTTITKQIEFDINECKNNNIKGTPSLVVNGILYEGALSINQLQIIIEQELDKKDSINSCH